MLQGHAGGGSFFGDENLRSSSHQKAASLCGTIGSNRRPLAVNRRRLMAGQGSVVAQAHRSSPNFPAFLGQGGGGGTLKQGWGNSVVGTVALSAFGRKKASTADGNFVNDPFWTVVRTKAPTEKTEKKNERSKSTIPALPSNRWYDPGRMAVPRAEGVGHSTSIFNSLHNPLLDCVATSIPFQHPSACNDLQSAAGQGDGDSQSLGTMWGSGTPPPPHRADRARRKRCRAQKNKERKNGKE